MNELDLQPWINSRITFQSEAAWRAAKPKLTELDNKMSNEKDNENAELKMSKFKKALAELLTSHKFAIISRNIESKIEGGKVYSEVGFQDRGQELTEMTGRTHVTGYDIDGIQDSRRGVTEIKTGENMSNTRLEEIKIQIAKLEDEQKAIESRKFEVCSEGFYLYAGGDSTSFDGDEVRLAERGRAFKTTEIAHKVDKLINPSYMIAQFVFNRCPDYAPDWADGEDDKCYVYFDVDDNEYEYSCTDSFRVNGLIFMSQEVAIELVELLNNGEYKL